MRKTRDRLLITLVLFSVTAVAALGATQAWARAEASSPCLFFVPSPGSTPDSGEPDVGQSGKPADAPRTGVSRGPGVRGSGLRGTDWIRWASMIWAAQHGRAGLF